MTVRKTGDSWHQVLPVRVSGSGCWRALVELPGSAGGRRGVERHHAEKAGAARLADRRPELQPGWALTRRWT